MKLLLPAVKPATPDPHREEVSGQTRQLLDEIDALIAAAEAAGLRARLQLA
ncbi:MAG TPA: hypothetical protein VK425_07015 [Acidimicrobiales bacterium]|nr:hypothetical protein [Acidimicrobiales bacterium]